MAADSPTEDKNEKTAADESSITYDTLSTQNEEYYQGFMLKSDAEALLKIEGDFILRKTEHETGAIIICVSVRSDSNKVIHFVINADPENKSFYIDESHKEDNVSKLIHWYKSTGTALSTASNAKLKRPINRPPWALNHEDIHTERKIGQGEFSELFLAWLTTEKGRVKTVVNALKIEVGGVARIKFQRLARMIRQFDHPNVLKIVGVAEHAFPLCIVMDFCEGGTMLSYLVNNGKTMPLKEKNRFVAEAAEGLAYLEKQKCIHRGIAARNFLLSGRNNTVKISDFRLSYDNVIVYEDTLEKIVLAPETVHWLAPEALDGKVYSLKTDVFAFGVLVWEIYSNGIKPYPGLTGLPRARKLEEFRGLGAPLIQAKIAVLCWEKVPDDRPAISGFLPDLKRLLLPVHYELEDYVYII